MKNQNSYHRSKRTGEKFFLIAFILLFKGRLLISGGVHRVALLKKLSQGSVNF